MSSSSAACEVRIRARRCRDGRFHELVRGQDCIEVRDRGASLYRVGGEDSRVTGVETGVQEPSARLGGSWAPEDHLASVDRRGDALGIGHAGPPACRPVPEPPLVGIVKTGKLRAGAQVYERQDANPVADLVEHHGVEVDGPGRSRGADAIPPAGGTQAGRVVDIAVEGGADVALSRIQVDASPGIGGGLHVPGGRQRSPREVAMHRDRPGTPQHCGSG